MISLDTFEAVVGAIYNDGDPNAMMLANEAALFFNTAIICEARGIKRALHYFKTEKGTRLYEPYLWGDPTDE